MGASEVDVAGIALVDALDPGLPVVVFSLVTFAWWMLVPLCAAGRLLFIGALDALAFLVVLLMRATLAEADVLVDEMLEPRLILIPLPLKF